MQKAEISSFAKLLVTETAQNLVRVFFLRDKLKSLADGKWDGRRIHVIGAGAMGGDIAAWCAWHGFTVSLADMKPEPLAGAIKRAAELYGKIGRDNRRKVRDALDRLIPDLKGEGVATADLIIEAVPENLELKQKIFAGIEPKMKPGAILATNTSSIPLEQLREGLQRPERLVGIHFFNPVSRMQLVEVVSHDKVADEVLADARAFLGRIDRLPAPVKSAPGFLVNRALTPYLLEAMVMLDEGMQEGDHRQGRGRLRHADGADRTGRPGRARHLPARRRDAARQPQPRHARPAAMAQGQGRQGRARQEDRQGPLRLEGRPRGQSARSRRAAAGHDRPPDPADARRLRRPACAKASSPTKRSSMAR